MEPLVKNTVVWAAIIVAVIVLYKFVQKPASVVELVESGRLAAAVQDGRVKEVSLPREATIEVHLKESGPDGKPARLRVATPAYRELVDELLQRNVAIRLESRRETSAQTALLTWLPFLVLAGVWMFFFRSMQAARKKAGAEGAATS